MFVRTSLIAEPTSKGQQQQQDRKAANPRELQGLRRRSLPPTPGFPKPGPEQVREQDHDKEKGRRLGLERVPAQEPGQRFAIEKLREQLAHQFTQDTRSQHPGQRRQKRVARTGRNEMHKGAKNAGDAQSACQNQAARKPDPIVKADQTNQVFVHVDQHGPQIDERTDKQQGQQGQARNNARNEPAKQHMCSRDLD